MCSALTHLKYPKLCTKQKSYHNVNMAADWKQSSIQSFLGDLLIPAPPASIWLLLVALMRLESINLWDYLAWGWGSWTSRAGQQKEKSCSWVNVRQAEEQLTPRWAQKSNRASATILVLIKADEWTKAWSIQKWIKLKTNYLLSVGQSYCYITF